MSDAHIKVPSTLDLNTLIVHEVISAAKAVVADISGNADERVRGNFVMVEVARMGRLVAAVAALDSISLPAGR